MHDLYDLIIRAESDISRYQQGIPRDGGKVITKDMVISSINAVLDAAPADEILNVAQRLDSAIRMSLTAMLQADRIVTTPSGKTITTAKLDEYKHCNLSNRYTEVLMSVYFNRVVPILQQATSSRSGRPGL